MEKRARLRNKTKIKKREREGERNARRRECKKLPRAKEVEYNVNKTAYGLNQLH